uniref:Odorant binding protein 9 n=1 Tax=Colaphellus bowringi TaxID=561076 RepID=A0A0S3J3B4_9CUCU|nr:odorant binding protein 9 [Colaphellus bowringi]
MKFLAYTVYLLLLFSVSIAVRNTAGKITQNESAKKTLGNCKTETGATMADIESLKEKKIPKTKTGRCFMECLFSKAKIMDNGRFNKKGMVVAFTPALKGDLTKMGKLRELSEVCEKEIGLNKLENCEGGKKIVECVAKHGKSYGMSFSTTK